MSHRLRWPDLLCSKRRKEVHGKTASFGTAAGREEIERDYDRILFAAPTRRMADKTQVFPMEANDSVRTRLTHSHEVSNLARSIGVRLAFNHRENVFGDCRDSLPLERVVPALLAAVGLAHDLGNPPFGHQGEVAMRRWFRAHAPDVGDDFLKFDGNCQTFRLLTRLQLLNDSFGLNLTYATLAGLLKYPVFSDCQDHSFRKFGIFRTERDIAQDVWKHTGLTQGVRHPLAYIMEACDDIAYSVIDAEDIVKKSYASFNDLMDHLKSCQDEQTNDVIEAALSKQKEFKQASLSSAELDDLSMQMFRVKAIAAMVESATRTFADYVTKMMSGEIDSTFELVGNSDSAALCEALKEFDRRYGFNNPAVLRLELMGDTYINETMDMLWIGIQDGESDDPFAKYAYRKISENYRRVYEKTERTECDRAHLLCDAVSGMTEGFLVSLHRELKDLQR